MWVPVAAALAHCKVKTKRVHAKTKDAVNMKFTSWHGICSGRQKMRDRNVSSKAFVCSYSSKNIHAFLLN
jgi:hypothetical protein